ncbi:MAG: hypothetical protein WC864_05555, partial [Ilumatobacteraceae bacterium]
PFSGFFSKDEIIDNVGHNGYNTFMIIGLIGAFMTAAYMTRATYLTFFGSPRGASAHGLHEGGARAPHESNWLITVPLVLLAVLALGSGLLNASPFGTKWERLNEWVDPRPVVVTEASAPVVVEAQGESVCGTSAPEQGVCFAPELHQAPFKWSKAGLSMAIVLAGILLSWTLSAALYTRKDPRLVGLTQRNPALRVGYTFLTSKYYLDVFYERVIIRAITGPIARGAYWFNQKILDGILHSIVFAGKWVAGWVYRNVDQRVVDGAVNNSGNVTRSAGGALQPVQSGRVSQYGALLFSAAAVAALVLVIVNT